MRRLSARYRSKVRQFQVPREAVQLGSSPGNDLIVPFPGVSRHHATVTPLPDGVLLTDLGSTNGLVREGRRLAEVMLLPGEAVQLGQALLILEEIPSSDGETGLRLAADASPTPPGDSRHDTPFAMASAGPASPTAALRLVRELERMPHDTLAVRRPELLVRAREVLAADALIILDPGTDAGCDAGVVACAGAVPDDGLLAELTAFARSDAGRGMPCALADGEVAALCVAGPRRRERLAALFAPHREPPDAWRCDFFSYLGEMLLEQAGDRSPAPSPSGGGELEVPPGMVIGSSAAMRDLLSRLRATVRSDLPVLLSGETGTGKELFALMIHASSPVGRGPFVAVNCAAIPTELLEAELFGVAARVATGVDPRPGLVVQAHGGSLFLDEIGDLPLALQAKLLRVLQQREVLPLGGSQPKRIAVRVIAASNRDLEAMRARGLFRDDLYYRLCGLHLFIPPLRERREDLPALILALAERAASKYGMRTRGLSRRALATLVAYPWPGNVRQLEHAIEQAVLLCPDGALLQEEHFVGLGRLADEGGHQMAVPTATAMSESLPRPLSEQVEEVERRAIGEALRLAAGNRSRAAKLLGITRNGLALKMRRLGLAGRRAATSPTPAK